MKKYGTLAALMLLIIASAGWLYAQQDQQASDNPRASMMGMGHGMMGDGGYSCMMGGLMSKSMVPTSDGGVIVLNGNKLTKYDGNLNVQKEVSLSTDTQYMKDMTNSWYENCPWMGGRKK